jgi:hypothetical protein
MLLLWIESIALWSVYCIRAWEVVFPWLLTRTDRNIRVAFSFRDDILSIYSGNFNSTECRIFFSKISNLQMFTYFLEYFEFPSRIACFLFVKNMIFPMILYDFRIPWLCDLTSFLVHMNLLYSFLLKILPGFHVETFALSP